MNSSAQDLAERIRGYWGVENKVHYVRDVTQGEDKSRIRTTPLVQIFALTERKLRKKGRLGSIYRQAPTFMCGNKPALFSKSNLVTRNFVLNLYRESGFENMAQANRLCSFGLQTLLAVFKMTTPSPEISVKSLPTVRS